MLRNVFNGLLFCTLILFAFSPAQAQTKYEKEILNQRKIKQKELMKKGTSPLQESDRKRMKSLNFFEVDTAWNKVARFEKLVDGDTIEMATSSGKSKVFVAYGTFIFEHMGKEDTLVGYRRIVKDAALPETLFVPFTDYSTGETTYGGGRYLDVDLPPADGDVVLDFNLCYNPYCAYGDGFSCPIPPKHNFIQLFVEAGERSYTSAE